LILCSPSNPTGTVYSASELDAVARWLRDRELVLISDEIYRNIYFGDEGGSAPGVLELAEDARGPFVLIDGVSKSFAMTGWRIGFGYTDPELAARMGALQSHITSNPSAPAQVAALAAYQDPTRAGQAVDDMVGSFRRRRDLVVGLVRELLPSCGFVEPRGAFYLFFRVDSAFTDGVTGSVDLCAKILDEVGVALVPGVAFGDDRFVRMSFATSDQLLEDGIRRITTVLG
jgi:aspartate aminotransferase